MVRITCKTRRVDRFGSRARLLPQRPLPSSPLLNETIADLIQPGLRTGELREAARKLGWRSLREMTWLKVQQGLIPISEQERWTRLIDPALLKLKTPTR